MLRAERNKENMGSYDYDAPEIINLLQVDIADFLVLPSPLMDKARLAVF